MLKVSVHMFLFVLAVFLIKVSLNIVGASEIKNSSILYLKNDSDSLIQLKMNSNLCINKPLVEDGVRCGEGIVTLMALANNGGTLTWYDSSLGGDILNTGTSYSPSLTKTTTYYVQEEVSPFIGNVGPANNNTINVSDSFKVSNQNRGLIFDALSDFILKTVDVYCSTSGIAVVSLIDSSGLTIISQNHTMVGNGKQVLNLDINVPEGNNYLLTVNSGTGGVMVFQRNYDCEGAVAYPYVLNDLVSIKMGNFEDNATCNILTNFYYFFYNWLIEENGGGCLSDRVEITATVNDIDSDIDGTLDCDDNCPIDPMKTSPGVCGCGISDVDSDLDGVPDCNDNCPYDPTKVEAGSCGCGKKETLCDDCNGDSNGNAYIDSCGECVGGNTDLNPCGLLCPKDPYVKDNSRCGEGVVHLSAETRNGGALVWYGSISDSDTLALTNIYSPLIGNTTTFYVQEVVSGGLSGHVGPETNNSINESDDINVFTTPTGLVFDVFNDVRIKTVDVYCSSKGEVIVSLQDSVGETVTSQTHMMIGNGKQVLEIGMDVPEGRGYKLLMASNSGEGIVFQRNYDCEGAVAYPYVFENLISIKSGSFDNSDVSSCLKYNNFYYFFYNWTVELSNSDCISKRVPIKGVVTLDDGIDDDGDGLSNCEDECPSDSGKDSPGLCGCGVKDLDSDNDGVADCNDQCPDDPNKTEAGICGCSYSETAPCYVSVDEFDDQLSVKIYPNPTSDILNVKLSKTMSYSFKVKDMIGKTVVEDIIYNKDFNQVNIDHLINGIYFFQIISDKVNIIHQIVKR